MGRSNATYRDTIRQQEERLTAFRRMLRRRDQAHFDRLFEHARNLADAGGAWNPTDPLPAVLFSVCLAQERERAALEDRVTELERRVDELEAELSE